MSVKKYVQQSILYKYSEVGKYPYHYVHSWVHNWFTKMSIID